MWKNRFYERRMSFQELATYPLSDCLLAFELMNRLEGFDPVRFFSITAEEWKHFEKKVGITNEITGRPFARSIGLARR